MGIAGPRWPLLAASLLGATGVMAGAFGAHGLASRVPLERLEVWQTAATYQLFHSIALLVLALSILYPSNVAKNINGPVDLPLLVSGGDNFSADPSMV